MRTSAKHPCRLIAAALAALQLCAGAAGAVFDNSFSYTYPLGSGLQYSRTEGKNSAGLQRANVLTYSPNTGVTPIMVYADEQLYGSKATITNAVKYLQNHGKTVLGGTNADFFVMSTGIPIGLVIDSGELISSDAWQYAVGFKKDGTAVLGRPTMGIRVSGKSGTVNVSYFNKTRTTAGAYLLDHNYDDSTHFAAKGTSIILERVDDTPVKVNGSVKLKVVNKGTGSSPITITKNQMVLTKSDGANVPSWVDFEVGEEVTLSIASNDSSWSDVQYAVGGKLLMDNSTITTDGIDAGSTRRARSAVGVKADGTVVLYEIDGNQPSYSIGLTAAELGQELKDLGCVRAICLDGRRLLRDGDPQSRREHRSIDLPAVGRLAARVRQLHFLCEQHRVGRRDGSCCAHAQPPLCAPGRKYLVLGQGCRCVLRLGGRTDRPQLHGE